jgi:hypothetical protein
MLHAGFNNLSGYKGTPSELIDTLLEAIGPDC